MSLSKAGLLCIVAVAFLSLSLPVAYGQHQHPSLAPPLRPLVKLVGFLNPTLSPNNLLPVVTLKLPGDQKRYTFLVTEIKVMAGPLRTAESILAEVKPYRTSFHIRTSRDIAAQIAAATPSEQLTILAQYSQADRALLIQGFEKGSADGSSQ
ncbi:MAG: hypothetical protein FJ147_03230 [Deltaproteobacteria bacterium]|nr:hypothetical protein [Deltaproteobacteria bacterium]